jgi:hypothetical protein
MQRLMLVQTTTDPRAQAIINIATHFNDHGGPLVIRHASNGIFFMVSIGLFPFGWANIRQIVKEPHGSH